jgi:GNAT superfamily N-acetyltransferase
MKPDIHIHEGAKAKADLEDFQAKEDLVQALISGYGEAYRDRMDELLPWARGNVTELAEQGKMFVAISGDKRVGMSGIDQIIDETTQKAGTNPATGREVWKVVRVAVLEEARGGGIGPRLIRRAMEEVWRRNPNAEILLSTENPGLVKKLDRWGFPHIEVEDMYKIYGRKVSEEQLKKERHISVYLVPPGTPLPEESTHDGGQNID